MATKKKAASRTRPSSRAADALGMLRADHEKVSEMFDRYENLRTQKQKESLAQVICNELKIHAQLEEEIFYPAAREAIHDEDLLEEATVEHQSAKDLIVQIEVGSAGQELFDAKVKVLGEYIKHHVKEEQNEMFPEVKQEWARSQSARRADGRSQGTTLVGQ